MSAAGIEPVALSSSLPETQHLSMALPDEDMRDDADGDDDAGTGCACGSGQSISSSCSAR